MPLALSYHWKEPKQSRHPPINGTFADETARLAATGFNPGYTFATEDIGGLAWQLDNDSVWLLTSIAPVNWVRVGSLLSKSGVLVPGDFAGTPKKATVTFVTPYASTAYVITLNAVTTDDSGYNMRVESKTAAGFIVSLGSNITTPLVEVGWHTVATGE